MASIAVAKIGGALATAPLAPAIAPLRAAGWAGRAAEAGVVGGGMGAAYGFGAGQGGLEERARSAVESGAMGMAAGAVASPVIDAAVAGGRAAWNAGRSAVAPMTAGGRECIAAEALDRAATDPQAVRQALGAGPQELVPGSMPTTFQQTGDMGLGGLERAVAAKNPAEFMQRRADQNTARLGALEGVQPGGHPEAVAGAFRSRLSEIDRETQSVLDGATEAAQGRVSALGGTGAPEGYGERLRASLTKAETTARNRERDLWKAVDPENRLTLQTSNVQEQARSIVSELAPTARPMEGEEAALFGVIGKLSPEIKFTHMSALRSRIGTAMRQELFANGRSPVYARLAALRGAVERDLEGVIARKAADEAAAVARGEMDPMASTMAARIQRERAAWMLGSSEPDRIAGKALEKCARRVFRGSILRRTCRRS